MQSPTELYGSLNMFQAHLWPLMISRLVHVGEYKWSARTTDYQGWLVCDGREVPRSEYPELFDVLGTAYGQPSSSDAFVLPDARGRVVGVMGAGADLTQRRAGDAVGAESHVLDASEMPTHAHAGITDAAGGHAHTASTDTQGAHSHSVTDPGHAHTQSTINDDFNNGGGSPPGFSADGAGSRTWSNINTATTGVSIDAEGAHAHTVTVDGAPAHQHAFVTASAGASAPFSLLQPTLFCGNLFIYSGPRLRKCPD